MGFGAPGIAIYPLPNLIQKAVKEVFGYMEDFVLPLGLTLIPPYPVNAGMAGVIIEGGVVKQVGNSA